MSEVKERFIFPWEMQTCRTEQEQELFDAQQGCPFMVHRGPDGKLIAEVPRRIGPIKGLAIILAFQALKQNKMNINQYNKIIDGFSQPSITPKIVNNSTEKKEEEEEDDDLPDLESETT